MNVGRAIYKILYDNIAVYSLVGNKIAPNVISQTTIFPFIVYDVEKDLPDGQKDSTALLDEYSIMVSGYSNTYSEASKLAQYIRTALDRVNGNFYGVDIQSIDFQGYNDVFDDDSGKDGIYRKSLDFKVRVTNSINNIYSSAFDGVDEYVSIPTSGLDSIKTTGSYSAWVKINTTSATGNILKVYIDNNNNISILYHAADNQLRFNYKAGGTANPISITDAVENTGLWYHVAATWNASSNSLKIYLNGTLKASATSITGTMTGSVTAAAIGNNAAGGGFFNGNIDELSIYTSELSASQILNIYNDGFPSALGDISGVIRWYKMGDGTFTGDAIATAPTIPDVINSQNGTMNNMVQSNFKADVPEG